MNSEFKDLVDCRKFVLSILCRYEGPFLKEIADLYEGRHGLDVAYKEGHTANAVLSDELDDLMRRIQEKIDLIKKEHAKNHRPVEKASCDQDTATKPREEETIIDALTAQNPKRADDRNPSAEAQGYSPHFYYDDRTVLEFNLLHRPDQHKVVLQLGYAEDYEMVLLAVSRNGASLQYATPCFRADRSIAKEALQQTGSSLGDTLAIEHVALELTDDKELMLLAVRANPCAYPFISQRLKNDPDILALPHSEFIPEPLDFECFGDGMK